MNEHKWESGPTVAGLVRNDCTCCATPNHLALHPQLDASRLLCPQTKTVYLDRGDGLFESEGCLLNEASGDGSGASMTADDLLSDRPSQTGSKTRIELERATFARGVF